MEERTSLSRKDLKRLDLANRFKRGEVRRRQVADLLGISERQVSRIATRVEREKELGVQHRSRGRRPNNRIDDEAKNKIVRLCRARYSDFGPTLAAEKLAEREGLVVSRETLRQWMVEAEHPYRKRRKRPHRQWRERKACFGEMLQMDGSRHAWFEDRGPECTLMAFIDDATGIVYARFYEYEGTHSAMDGFRRYAAEYGLPASVYLDRHSTYKGQGEPTLEQELKGEGPMSQFERALSELEVRVIHALSPQAKGRVERYFGTSQDRLIKELRLAGICGITDGNRFLETAYLKAHNRRYRKVARCGTNVHRPRVPHHEMMRIMSVREERKVKNDSTIYWAGRILHLKSRTWARKVTVEQRLDGRMVIRDRNRVLEYEDITSKVKAGSVKVDTAAARPPRGAVKVREARLTWG